MKIAGLQKVSTIDYPGEICCVVFLWGCNFRCGFCYNSSLVVRDLEFEISEEEFFEFLEKRRGKLDAVCVSGGEPLASLEMGFVRRIKEMGFKVKIDTNGSFPEKLREFVNEGLVDYIAMDVKGRREDYCEIVNVDVDLGKIEESIRIVNDFGKGEIGTRIHTDSHGLRMEVGSNNIDSIQSCDICDVALRVKEEVGRKEKGDNFRSEFRTTLVPGLHDCDKLIEMGKWMNEICEGKPNGIFLQGFKRGEDMIDKSFEEKNEVLEGELVRLKSEVEDLFGEVGVRV